MLSRTFKAFQYREFRVMWAGACTSSIGTWMQNLAQSWLVYQISNDAFYLGLDAFLGQIPIFLFSVVGGVVADRVDRRHVLLGSQLVQMTCAFLLAALFAVGVVEVWHILCLSFVVGTAQAFGGPAYSALVPTLVGPDDLPNAIAMNSIQFNLARVIGPVLGGLALTKLGAAWCFGLNGASFIAVIITLLMIRSRFQPRAGQGSMMASMKQGFAFIRGQGGMIPLIVLAFLMTLLGTPTLVFLPAFARDVFQGSANTLTLMLVMSGSGSILGALLVATFHHGQRKGRIALLVMTFLGICTVAFSMSVWLPASCAILFLASASLMIVFALVSSLVQLITSDDMRGRVMSVYNVAFRGGMPFGSLVTGIVAKDLAAPVVIAVNGVLLSCLGLYYLLAHKKVSSL